MTLVHTIIAFLIALGILILFHELGHYWAARWCGVKVLRFSVGFGKPLVIKRGSGPDHTEWSIGALPFGGYVKMLDEREAPVAPAEVHRAFNRKGVGARMFIVAAGPLANFLLAIAVYAGLYMNGVSEPKAILAQPEAGTPAAAAGIAAGDVVRSLNGQPVHSWQDFRWSMLDLAIARRGAVFEVESDGKVVTRRLDLSTADTENMEADPLGKMGVRLYRPAMPPVIGRLESGSPAATAGLREGDRVRSIDGEPIDSFEGLVKRVVAAPDKALAIVVDREDGTRTTLSVTPRAVDRNGTTIGRIGAGPRMDPEQMKSLFVEERYGLFGAIARATAKTWEMSVFSLKMLGRMLVGDLSWRNLSGPVTIADYAGQSASLGFLPYLTFIALVSISLGVLNLLPIPVLDGGHLMYYTAEVVMRRPLSDRTIEMSQRVGFAILLGLMAFAFYNDINRLLAS